MLQHSTRPFPALPALRSHRPSWGPGFPICKVGLPAGLGLVTIPFAWDILGSAALERSLANSCPFHPGSGSALGAPAGASRPGPRSPAPRRKAR